MPNLFVHAEAPSVQDAVKVVQAECKSKLKPYSFSL